MCVCVCVCVCVCASGLPLSMQQGDSELGLKRALLVALRGCRFILVLWLTSRWTYSAPLPLSLSASLPGRTPHMGPCRHFSYWIIGRGFNFQIAALSVRPVWFFCAPKIKVEKAQICMLLERLLLCQTMSWDLLRNKRRDVGGMVWNIPINNPEHLEFLCDKKRGE